MVMANFYWDLLLYQVLSAIYVFIGVKKVSLTPDVFFHVEEAF